MKIFDTHSHYDDSRYDDVGREELLNQLFDTSVCGIVGASVTTYSSKAQLAIAEKFPNYYVAVGVHPSNIFEQTDLDSTLSELRELLTHPKAVAIGEIGLDYYWDDNPSRDIQKMWFESQMQLAQEMKLPVVIHDREAHGDVFDMICKYPDVIGVLHSCSASAEMVKELVKRGWYISFSGVITYKNATKVAEVVKTVPDDRILVETDCPYLSPVPMRGKTNRSDYALYTAAKAAELRGCDVEEFSEKTTENAMRVFGIKELN